MMNQKQVQDLIKFVAKSGVTEVEIEEKDFKIIVKNEAQKADKREEVAYIQQPVMQQPQQQIPVPTQPQAAPPANTGQSEQQSAPQSDAGADSKLVEIKSPMIGTFYRASAPDKPLFVEVGDTVKKGDTVCIIEAMKLFNEIESEVSGKIVKVLVDDATPVEYDQPLFLVDPS